MDKVLRLVDRVSAWSGGIAAYVFPTMVLVTVYEVIFRYVFKRPTAWAFEMSLFICGGTSLIGGAYCLLHKAHIRIDVIWNRFSSRWKAILDLVTFTPFFLFILVLVLWGWEAAWTALQPPQEISLTPWAPVMWPIKITIPIGAFLILLQAIAKFIRDLRTAATGKDEVQ